MAVFRRFLNIICCTLFVLVLPFVSANAEVSGCSSNQVDVDGHCVDGKFAIKTVFLSANDTFQFKISAAGNFIVKCGNDGTLSGSGVSGNTITRNSIGTSTYTCTYSTGGVKVLSFKGAATGYSTSITAAISFYTSQSNALKIASISGSLGAIFGTVSNPTIGQGQPRFYQTFYNASNMTGSIPANLFTGISGAPASHMFARTFEGCSGLTGSIPATLFSGISGSPADSMFYYTFYNCSGLTGLIPATLFSGISGAPAQSMFSNTFYGCSGLTGSIPANLFAGISGTPAEYMFYLTFNGCSGLTGSIPANLFAGISGVPATNMFRSTFAYCSGLTGSIPADLFAGISGAPAQYMFYQTFRECSGLTGSIPVTLFSGISGAPAQYMFYYTFYGCSGLAGFTDGTNTTTYVPDDFLSGINTDTSVSYQVFSMFYNTGLAGSCPSGTYQTTRSQFSNARKPWCAACPDGKISQPGSTSVSGCVTGYTVSLYQNSSTDDNNINLTLQILDGDVMPEISAPIREGYVFTGYYDARTGGNKYYNSDMTSVRNWDKASNGNLYAQWLEIPPSYTFSLTTTYISAGTVFKFRMSAAGTFYVDWGDGHKILIDRTNDITYAQYSHKYANSGIYTIRFAGQATGFNNTSDKIAAISFGNLYNGDNTPEYVASVSGSLGSIFGTVSNPTVGIGQPRFLDTFAQCTNLTSVPETLFTGVTGAPISYMFGGGYYAYGYNGGTFTGCSKLTSIPGNLFSGIQGAPAPGMFAGTFLGSGLTSIPENLFSGIQGAPAEDMFLATFYECEGITSIPENLFAGIHGAPAPGMFGPKDSGSVDSTGFGGCFGETNITSIPEKLFCQNPDNPNATNCIYGAPAQGMFNGTFASTKITSVPNRLFIGINGTSAGAMFNHTFRNCSLLNSFTDGTNTTSYVPESFLSSVVTVTNTSDRRTSGVYGMFSGTSLDSTCPSGTYQTTRSQFSNASKPWCAACPDGKTSQPGSTSVSGCVTGYTVSLYQNEDPLNDTANATVIVGNNIEMPSRTINGVKLQFPVRSGYTFNGYYSDRSGGTKYYDVDMSSVQNWNNNDGGALYAQWIECGNGYESIDNACICVFPKETYNGICHMACDTGETWNGTDACVCDNANNYYGTAGSCNVCDVANGYTLSNNTCSCVSPKVEDNGVCHTACGANETWNGTDACVCDNSRNYYGTAGSCAVCDTANGYTLSNNTCSCVSPKVEDNGVCHTACGANEIWNGSACVCDSSNNYYGTAGSCTVCDVANGYTLSNNTCSCLSPKVEDNGVCHTACGANETWNGSACVCDSANNYYGTAGSCTVCDVANGYTLSNNTCSCVSPKVEDNGVCHTACDENETWKNGECVQDEPDPAQECEIQGQYYHWDSENEICEYDAESECTDQGLEYYWDSENEECFIDEPDCPMFSTTLASGPVVELPGMGIDLNNDNQITGNECVATRIYGGALGSLMSADNDDIPPQYLQLVQLARSQNTYDSTHAFNYAAMVFVFCKYNSQTGNYDGDCTYAVPICDIFGNDLDSLTGTTTSDMFDFAVDYIESKTNQTILPSAYENMFTLNSSNLSANIDVYRACDRGCSSTTYWDGWECMVKDDNYCHSYYGSDNIWDSENEECVVSCSEDGYFPDHYDSGSYGYCSYYDMAENAGECATVVSLYGDTYYWNSENNRCERCDSSNVVDNGVCHEACGTGETWSNGECVCDNSRNYYGAAGSCAYCGNGYTWANNTCSCVSPNVEEDGICHSGKFALKTTSTTDSFQFKISAAGNFTVDCGDGGSLSGTGVSGNTITRNNTDMATYTCTWSNAGSHVITFDGSATGYSTSFISAAITFNINGYNDANAQKIASIYGSLSAIFGTIANPTVGIGQPRFISTFESASNMTGTNIDDPNNTDPNTGLPMKYALPPTLFSDITGSLVDHMFYSTFFNCSGLTGSIPSGLFGNLTGSPASDMFADTFRDCSSLSGQIPSGLFGNLTGSPASNMFYQTFMGCGNLTGYIPKNLFGNLSGAPAQGMFLGTFDRCSGLTGFTDGTNTTTYVPGDFLSGINTNTSVPNQVYGFNEGVMFGNTGLLSTCPDGTTDVTREQFNSAGKPWCSPCPDGTTSIAGGQCQDPRKIACEMQGPSYYWDNDSCQSCGTGEIWNGTDACVCDSANNYYGTAGSCAVCDTANGYTWENNTCSCVSPNVEENGICHSGKFALKTTSTTDSFQFMMSAAGNFTVDCGDGGSLSGTGVSGNTITRNNTDEATYTCTWSNAGSHVITFDGSATGYSTNSYIAEISFYTSQSNAQKIASISGSLGSIFGTVANPTTGQGQPRFYQTFAYASNMTGSIPATLFSGISGAPAAYMFGGTFSGCSGLTGSIPATLFSGISGAPAAYMFAGTFYGCSGLTGSIPATLFSGISGAPASLMFNGTFAYCRGLTGSIPATLFSGISGVPAHWMFTGTFEGCSGLTGFTDGTNTTTYVPGDFLSGIDTNTSVSSQAINMFDGTQLAGSCPSGTTDVTREQFNNAQKPWCATPQIACEIQGPSYYWYNDTCQSCGTGETWNGSACVCDSANNYYGTAGSCTVCDVANGYTVTNNTCSCVSPKVEDATNHICHDACIGDYVWRADDEGIYGCGCAAGTFADPNNSATCLPWNDENCAYINGTTNDFYSGYYWDGEQCQYYSCDIDTEEWDSENHQCVALCPGYSENSSDGMILSNDSLIVERGGFPFLTDDSYVCVNPRVYIQNPGTFLQTGDISDISFDNDNVSMMYCILNPQTGNYDYACTQKAAICSASEAGDLLELGTYELIYAYGEMMDYTESDLEDPTGLFTYSASSTDILARCNIDPDEPVTCPQFSSSWNSGAVLEMPGAAYNFTTGTECIAARVYGQVGNDPSYMGESFAQLAQYQDSFDSSNSLNQDSLVSVAFCKYDENTGNYDGNCTPAVDICESDIDDLASNLSDNMTSADVFDLIIQYAQTKAGQTVPAAYYSSLFDEESDEIVLQSFCSAGEEVTIYTITLDKNGGDANVGTDYLYAVPSGQNKTYGVYMDANATEPGWDGDYITVPTRSGYTFLGYYDTAAATGGTQMIDQNGLILNDLDSSTSSASSDYSIYARWESNGGNQQQESTCPTITPNTTMNGIPVRAVSVQSSDLQFAIIPSMITTYNGNCVAPAVMSISLEGSDGNFIFYIQNYTEAVDYFDNGTTPTNDIKMSIPLQLCSNETASILSMTPTTLLNWYTTTLPATINAAGLAESFAEAQQQEGYFDSEGFITVDNAGSWRWTFGLSSQQRCPITCQTGQYLTNTDPLYECTTCDENSCCLESEHTFLPSEYYGSVGLAESYCPTNDTSYCQDVFGPGYTWDDNAGECVGDNDTYCVNTYGPGYHWDDVNKVCSSEIVQTSCPAGAYMDNGVCISCALGTNGAYTQSDGGLGDINTCYRTCSVSNATSVTGRDYYGTGVDTCEPTACATGYSLTVPSITLNQNPTIPINPSDTGNDYGYVQADGTVGGSDMALVSEMPNNTWASAFDEGIVYGRASCQSTPTADNIGAFYVLNNVESVLNGEMTFENFKSGLAAIVGNTKADWIEDWFNKYMNGDMTYDEVALAVGRIFNTAEGSQYTTTSSGQYCYCQVTGYQPTGESKQNITNSPWFLWLDTGSSSNCASDCANYCAEHIMTDPSRTNAAVTRAIMFGYVDETYPTCAIDSSQSTCPTLTPNTTMNGIPVYGVSNVVFVPAFQTTYNGECVMPLINNNNIMLYMTNYTEFIDYAENHTMPTNDVKVSPGLQVCDSELPTLAFMTPSQLLNWYQSTLQSEGNPGLLSDIQNGYLDSDGFYTFLMSNGNFSSDIENWQGFETTRSCSVECGTGETDDGTGSCICDESQGYYGDAGSCQYCDTSNGQTWDGSACVSICGAGETWDGSACICDSANGYYDQDGICMLCDDGRTLDDSGACVSICGDGETWDGSTCVSICGDGETWDGSACVSICGDGETWDGSACVSICGENETWNGSACECDSENNYYGTPGSCVQCGEHEVWDPTAGEDGACVCDNSSNYYGDAGSCTVCDVANGYTLSNNICSCVSPNVEENGICNSGKFALKTTSLSANSTFGFYLSAAGNFTVDCGDGGSLSGTGVSGNTITRNNTNVATYTCSWSNAGSHVITFDGSATGYTYNCCTADDGSAISFDTSQANAQKIASISGSLGAIFGTVANPTTGQGQPKFISTFSNASNMTGSIPANLFSGISGAPAERMFNLTFSGCSGLTGSIPSGLFGNISGAPTEGMFAQTFSGCSGLTGFTDGTNTTTYVPGDFLSGINTDTSVSSQATSMFNGTQLADSCPSGTTDVTREQFNNAGKPWCAVEQQQSCSANYFLDNGTCKSCSTETNGTYAYSDADSTSINQCYTSCVFGDVDNAASVSGNKYYDGSNNCAAVSCNNGYYKFDLPTIIGNANFEGVAFTSVKGNGYNFNQNEFGITDNAVFMIDYENSGRIKGTAQCSSVGRDIGSYIQENTLPDNTGRYCWCKMDEYTSVDNVHYNISGPWISNKDAVSASSCDFYCSYYCYDALETFPEFKTALFSSGGATCEPNIYTITLNKNAEDATDGTTTVYEKYANGFFRDSGAVTSISQITAPVRSGYDFLGYFNSDATVQYIDENGNMLVEPTTFNENTTLYAEWGKKTLNDGECPRYEDTPAYDPEHYLPNSVVGTKPASSNYYYYYYSPAGKENKLGGCQVFFNVDNSLISHVRTNMTGYTHTMFRVLYNPETGNYDKIAQIQLGGVGVSDDIALHCAGGYVSKPSGNGMAWYSTLTDALQNACIAGYSITYNNMTGATNDGKNPRIYATEYTPIELHPASKKGYTFMGWYNNEELIGEPIEEIPAGSTGEKTFWAKWEEICYAPEGMSNVCFPHVLHVGDGNVYLSATKRTTPALNVAYDGAVFYANMTTVQTPMSYGSERQFKIIYNNQTYYICDDTVWQDDFDVKN